MALTTSAYAKKITIKDVQSKVQTLQESVKKTISKLRKSNRNSKDLKGQIKVLGETISVFEDQLKAIEEGGEIYSLSSKSQEISTKNIKTFEDKIAGGTLTSDTIKGFEKLIKRQKSIINDLGNLQVDMSEKASRIRAKIKSLKSNQELIVATMLVDAQEEAVKQLKACLNIFDSIEKDIDDLNARAKGVGEARSQ
jgi:hypothetical protein